MRLPAQEHDGTLVAPGALDLRQHALLGALDQLEAAEAELVVVDHLLDQPVAVVAGLDAVDLAVELVLELGDVSEVLETLVIQVLRHRQRVLRTVEVGANHLDTAVRLERGDVGFHGRHPVAEEDVDVAVLHALIGHRDRQDVGRRLVAQGLQDDRGQGGRRGDVGPADIREPHRLAAVRLGR